MEYPEHEKLKAVQAETQFLGEFIEWLRSNNMCIAVWDDKDRLSRSHKSINSILSEFKSIDLIKLEEEKKQMLSHFQKNNSDGN